MRKSLILAGLLIVALLRGVDCEAQPMGYERWTVNSSVNSSAFFDLTPKDLLTAYADPLLIGMPGVGSKATRVIDIEYNLNSQTGDYLMSGIWIDNDGDFKQESWFVPRLTHEEVILMEQKMESLMVVDIERFEVDGQTLFGAIVERNRVKKEWRFWTEITMQSINAWRNEGYRVIDIDYVRMDLDARGNPEPRFDVVFAENAGENFIQDGIAFRDTGNVWNLTQLGNQVIDVEYIPELDKFVCSYVERGTFWDFMWNQSAASVNALNSMGRTVDLEGSHSGSKQWFKIHLFGN